MTQLLCERIIAHTGVSDEIGIASNTNGLLICKTLQERIKQKLFSKASRLTDYEIVAALRALQLQSPLLEKDQALEVLAAICQEVAASLANPIASLFQGTDAWARQIIPPTLINQPLSLR